MSSSTIEPRVRQLDIEFLFLDLDTCTRCRATDATLVQALGHMAPALEAAGVMVSLTKTLVADEDTARRFRFVSSPTIRINGVDVAAELVESTCESCGELCACGGEVACRDWLWRGERSTQPPVGLIVEALMRHAAGPAADPSEGPQSPHGPFELPENLRQFFATASPNATIRQATVVLPTSPEAACCTADLQVGCGHVGTEAATAPSSCNC